MQELVKEGLQFLKWLWFSASYGPFQSYVDTDEFLDEPLYHLFDEVFGLTRSMHSWFIAAVVFIIKPIIHLFGRDLINR